MKLAHPLFAALERMRHRIMSIAGSVGPDAGCGLALRAVKVQAKFEGLAGGQRNARDCAKLNCAQKTRRGTAAFQDVGC